ncbi:MAG: tetratricopeptide repeat protein [Chitinispirillaceae bacterium]|nr:tetratricopeptide repeat protein [Chitinispirillaceae bacterium]
MLMKHAVRSAPIVSLCISAVLSGCSTYFNTFYNAESAFDEGYALHKKVLRNYPDSIVVEPPQEARAKYDRAIEKAAKVLEVFPKDKEWHDDAYFLMGKSYLYLKETVKALRWFRQLQGEFPRSPFVPESYVYMTQAYILEDNLSRAEETASFALKQYPFLDKEQKLSLLLVEAAVRREGKAQAVGLLEEARRSARSSEKRFELLVRAAELYIDLRQYDRAAALLRSAPRSGKSPGQEYRVDRDLVACFTAADSLEQALGLLAAMKARRRYAPYVKEILFRKAALLARLGRTDEAIEAYRQVTGGKEIDTAAARADTSALSGRAWYELGLLYQKRKGDYRQAEKCYALTAGRQARDTAVTSRAEKRLKAMKDLREWRDALAGRDTLEKFKADPFALPFKIGELFYYELDEPDSAFRQFISIVNDTPAAPDTCVARALFAAGYIARAVFRDTVRSDSLYRLCGERFPASDFIAGIRGETAGFASFKTRRELAAEAFRAAEQLYGAGADAKAAVQAYYNVYRQYPDLEIAEKSLFAAAWITDNELQKKKVAKSLYERICERYPKSTYCTDRAKPKLKTVTDTLEALRREREGAGGAAVPGGPPAPDSGTIVDSLQAAADVPAIPPNPKMFPRGPVMTEPPTRRTYKGDPGDTLHR